MKQIKQNSTQIPASTENFSEFLQLLVVVVAERAEPSFPFAKKKS